MFLGDGFTKKKNNETKRFDQWEGIFSYIEGESKNIDQ